MSETTSGGHDSFIARLVGWAAHYRGWTLVVWILFLIAAAVMSRNLKLDALPDPTNNQVLVLTRAPGLTPEEVELRITLPIETAVGGVPGLAEHRSSSRYGLSAITLIFGDDVDPYLARQLVHERLQGVHSMLPSGSEAPEMGPMTGGLGEVFHFTLSASSRTTAELFELATWRVAPLLRSLEGVVEVNTWGGERRAFVVTADVARLAARGLTLDTLRSGMERALGTVAGASLSTGEGQALLRGVYLPRDTATLAGTIVAQDKYGGLVRLADVATLSEGALPRLGAAITQGQGETVYVMVQMLTGANAYELTERIRAALPLVQRALPEDVRVDVVYDRAALVSATLHTVAKNLLEGGLLVILVLLVLLGSLRAGLLVAATIPVAMLGATAAMSHFGIPGNLMSLGALDFGLLVDGAVVMVENAMHAVMHDKTVAHLDSRAWHARMRHIMMGLAGPVFSGVLIIMLVYVPVLSMTGVDGKLFRPMALTVVFALLTAILFTVTLVPAVLAWILPANRLPKQEPRVMRWIAPRYSKLLAYVAERQRSVAAISLGVLCIGIALFMVAGRELVPQLDEGDLVIQTTRAADIQLETAVNVGMNMEKNLREQFPEIARIVSRIGSPAVATDTMGLDQADVFVRLHDVATWRPQFDGHKDALVDAMREYLEGTYPEVETSFTQPIQMRFNELLGGAPTDVVVSIYGDDLKMLWKMAVQVRDTISKIHGVSDPRVLAPAEVPLIDVEPMSGAAGQMQISVAEVLQTVQSLKLGIPVGHTYDGIVPIPILLKSSSTQTASGIGQSLIASPSGALIPLAAVANIDERTTPSVVLHDGGARRLLVGFNVVGADLAGVVANASNAVEKSLQVPHGYRVEWGGQVTQLNEASARLRWVIPAVLAGIAAVLFITFRNVRIVFTILTHVPFACVGGIVFLALRGMPVSMSAAIGFIALSGIAVMNGVVLMAQVRRNQAGGMSARDAALAAARSRMPAVLMTALVAALGFVPMMLAHGVGAEVQRPLATVVVGGLLTSTLLTLFILPTLFPMFVKGSSAGDS